LTPARRGRSGSIDPPNGVLEPEDRARLGAEPLEQRQERVEEAALGLALTILPALLHGGPEFRRESCELAANGVGEVVEDGVVGARQGPHSANERGIGELVIPPELDAVASGRACAQLRGSALELGQQARLADTRLARNEHELRATGAGVC
jgi:hypothetical protein